MKILLTIHHNPNPDAFTGDAWVWAKMLPKPTQKHPALITQSHDLEHATRPEEIQRENLCLSWKYSL